MRLAAVLSKWSRLWLVFLATSSCVKLTRCQSWGGITGREVTVVNNQRGFLEDLYDATDGWNWRYKWDMNFESDPCLHKWYGVWCDNEGNVIKLILPQNRMKGALPGRFNRLEKLQAIDLSFNQLVNNFPGSLAEISTLKHINVQSNFFNGFVPSALGLMSHLTFLDIGLNRFEGDIPASILERRDRGHLRFHETKYGGENSGVKHFDTKYGKHDIGEENGDGGGYLHPAVPNKGWGP